MIQLSFDTIDPKSIPSHLPLPSNPIKDVASELADEQDLAIQRDKTFKILKTLVKPHEVNQVLFKLQEDGDLFNFVKYSSGFINELSIKTDLTATLFNSAWRRYKEKLIMTDNTGIAIPPTAREYAAEFLDIANELRGLPSKLTYELERTLHLYRDWETDRKSTRLNSSH